MRKRIRSLSEPPRQVRPDEAWLDLQDVATVEATSEDETSPIESAFIPGREQGWRAAQGGEQTIRLLFDEPITLHRIRLCFRETNASRTQEFSLKWFGSGGNRGEVIRQQWNFAPDGSTVEVEDYPIELPNVIALELLIRPDISGTDAYATLAEWRVGGEPS